MNVEKNMNMNVFIEINRVTSNREMPTLYSFRNCGVYFISVHKVAYSQERNQLFQSLRMVNQNNFTMQCLLGKTSSNIYHFV